MVDAIGWHVSGLAVGTFAFQNEYRMRRWPSHTLALLGTCALLSNASQAQRLVVLVNDELGKPLPGAHVSLRDARDKGVKPSAKKDGVFTFQEVPEGYNALQVKAGGMQMNGCQWFGAMPDTIRMTMHPGRYYTLQEGQQEARLVFDERRLEVDYHKWRARRQFAGLLRRVGPGMREVRLNYPRKKYGKKFMLHCNTELEAVRKNRAVISAGLYAEHRKRHLHEGVGVTPHAGLSMTQQHQFTGVVDVVFNASDINTGSPQALMQRLNSVLVQFGFRTTGTLDGWVDEGVLLNAFHSPGVELAPVFGMAGPFLIGQLEQLARHPVVGKVELVVPLLLDRMARVTIHQRFLT